MVSYTDTVTDTVLDKLGLQGGNAQVELHYHDHMSADGPDCCFTIRELGSGTGTSTAGQTNLLPDRSETERTTPA